MKKSFLTTVLERMAISAFEGVVKEADNLIQEARKEISTITDTKPVSPITVEVETTIIDGDCRICNHHKAAHREHSCNHSRGIGTPQCGCSGYVPPKNT